jgi:polyphosphate kinase 2 (PPK2 family)
VHPQVLPARLQGEQRERFLARLDEPEKNWKFAAADVEERRHWDEYMKAYEKMIEATTSEQAPWFVIPADHKWFTRLAVADVIVETMNELDSTSPRSRRRSARSCCGRGALLEGG